MIPKKIHYCWFGRGEKPELAKKCIESWKKYLPEYEIKEWNEDNFDMDKYPYAREAYDSRKFAFVTDVVRLYALYNEGGIYMDTDVEVLKPLDNLLEYDGISGFESSSQIPTGLMASHKNHPAIKDLLEYYNGRHFRKEDGTIDTTTNVEIITNYFISKGFIPNNTLQTINNYSFLPSDYLCPKSYKTGKINITENTITIHHFAGSWQDDVTSLAIKRARKLNYLPYKLRSYISHYSAMIQLKGLTYTLKYIKKRYKEIKNN